MEIAVCVGVPRQRGQCPFELCPSCSARCIGGRVAVTYFEFGLRFLGFRDDTIASAADRRSKYCRDVDDGSYGNCGGESTFFASETFGRTSHENVCSASFNVVTRDGTPVIFGRARGSRRAGELRRRRSGSQLLLLLVWQRRIPTQRRRHRVQQPQKRPHPF